MSKRYAYRLFGRGLPPHAQSATGETSATEAFTSSAGACLLQPHPVLHVLQVLQVLQPQFDFSVFAF